MKASNSGNPPIQNSTFTHSKLKRGRGQGIEQVLSGEGPCALPGPCAAQPKLILNDFAPRAVYIRSKKPAHTSSWATHPALAATIRQSGFLTGQLNKCSTYHCATLPHGRTPSAPKASCLLSVSDSSYQPLRSSFRIFDTPIDRNRAKR